MRIDKEKRQEYSRKYYLLHKKKYNEYNKKWKKNHSEYFKIYMREWCKKNKERRHEYRKIYNTNWRIKIKTEVFTHYCNGEPFCMCCGEKILAFLTIDHMNGGGNKHRKEIGVASGIFFWSWLKKNNYPDGFQVLCYNCNQGKGSGSECPHKLQEVRI